MSIIFCFCSLPRSPAQIKHFLKEDSEEAELVQFLNDSQTEKTSRRVKPEAIHQEKKSCPGVTEMFPSAAVQAIPKDALEEKEQKAFYRPHPLDLKQQHMAAPAPPSPSRPRSPWGRLDPYESDEVKHLCSISVRIFHLSAIGGIQQVLTSSGELVAEILSSLENRWTYYFPCWRKQRNKTRAILLIS
uniref:Uncharacterized protein n=1 Tax=Pseudonaja textilis TaxID=8673 RepID=A0A670YUE8_PSETE